MEPTDTCQGGCVPDCGCRTGSVSTSRRCEAMTRPDGTAFVPSKPPRADLLRYPHHGDQVSVLVRRTQDLVLARRLAEQRWLEHAVDRAMAASAGRCLMVSPPPLAEHRVGWWTTTTARTVPPRGALDERDRVVVWCADPARSRSAGPGIEFRPAQPLIAPTKT